MLAPLLLYIYVAHLLDLVSSQPGQMLSICVRFDFLCDHSLVASSVLELMSTGVIILFNANNSRAMFLVRGSDVAGSVPEHRN